MPRKDGGLSPSQWAKRKRHMTRRPDGRITLCSKRVTPFVILAAGEADLDCMTCKAELELRRLRGQAQQLRA